MSALPSYTQRQSRPATHLGAVPLGSRRTAHPLVTIATIVIVGFIAIPLLNLMIFVSTSANQYQLANLKAQRDELTISAQILQQQVDSLSSNQNLSDAAEALGMVSNANPVFLSVTEQKVYGKAKAALANTTGRVSGNLVSNLALTTKTNAAKLRAALAKQEREATRAVNNAALKSGTVRAGQKPASGTIPAADFGAAGQSGKGNVANGQKPGASVSSVQSEIPGSPTN